MLLNRDPEIDTIKVYRRVDERNVRAAELSLENGHVLTTPLLPGLELPLSKIFED
jgi:Uma2 family endonuclease